LAGLLILAAASFHLVYPGPPCVRLTWPPTRAHYWDWSRHLELELLQQGAAGRLAHPRSHASWLAPWSEHYTGKGLTFAVSVGRPSLCGSLLLCSLYVLTVQVFARARWHWPWWSSP